MKRICEVCKEGSIGLSKKPSTKPNVTHYKCYSSKCQAKFNQVKNGNLTFFVRVA